MANRNPADAPAGMADAGYRRLELSSLLSLCGTLAGLCIGIVAFINGNGKGNVTLVDDVLAACSAVFLLCIYLIVWAGRSRSAKRAAFLGRLIETLFLVDLTVMTIAGFLMVYTIW